MGRRFLLEGRVEKGSVRFVQFVAISTNDITLVRPWCRFLSCRRCALAMRIEAHGMTERTHTGLYAAPGSSTQKRVFGRVAASAHEHTGFGTRDLRKLFEHLEMLQHECCEACQA
mmetsp:Transcript_107877/g.344336  ORF Transcript_107877/g.344336 Transcript_107877/m.344336 type:complete len:115 (+) Transcript_107877:954-1298(+)